jgi:16S rRNA (guanine966-N2)-methyltransferase
VREAVFDVLAALPEVGRQSAGAVGVLAGHAVLDLFAGSGALGIEALSRGADTATFVERDRAALRALHTNLERLGVGPAGGDGRARSPAPAARPLVRVVAAEARRALQADAMRGARYTLLFVDPPYGSYAEVEPALVSHLGPVLAPGAVLVFETDARTEPALPWRVIRQKRYGDTQVTFLVADDLQDAEGADDDDAEAT